MGNNDVDGGRYDGIIDTEDRRFMNKLVAARALLPQASSRRQT